MDLVIVPSQSTPLWKEQFGRVVIEAFACGIPVIASDSGEIPYVVGGAGLIVPESDIDAWTEAIAGLLQSPDRRRELAAAGYDRCEQHYFTQRVADDTINYYRKIMDTPAPDRGRGIKHATGA
jgi:glycosyltransferase involved in cell wall biosynthesis